jgi:hypothetical protein
MYCYVELDKIDDVKCFKKIVAAIFYLLVLRAFRWLAPVERGSVRLAPG